MPIQNLPRSSQSFVKSIVPEHAVNTCDTLSLPKAVTCAQKTLSITDQPSSKPVKTERAKSWFSKRNVIAGTIVAMGAAVLLGSRASQFTSQPAGKSEQNSEQEDSVLTGLGQGMCFLRETDPFLHFFADAHSLPSQKPKDVELEPTIPQNNAWAHAIISEKKVKKLVELGRYAHAFSVAKSIHTPPHIKDNALMHLIEAVAEHSWEMALKAAVALSPHTSNNIGYHRSACYQIIFSMEKKYSIEDIFTLTQNKIPENISNDFFAVYASRIINQRQDHKSLTDNEIVLIKRALSMITNQIEYDKLVDNLVDRLSYEYELENKKDQILPIIMLFSDVSKRDERLGRLIHYSTPAAEAKKIFDAIVDKSSYAEKMIHPLLEAGDPSVIEILKMMPDGAEKFDRIEYVMTPWVHSHPEIAAAALRTFNNLFSIREQRSRILELIKLGRCDLALNLYHEYHDNNPLAVALPEKVQEDLLRQLEPYLIEEALGHCHLPLDRQWRLVQQALSRDSLFEKEGFTRYDSDIQSLVRKFVRNSIETDNLDLAEQAVDALSSETWVKQDLYEKIKGQLSLSDRFASWFTEDTHHARLTRKINDLYKPLAKAQESQGLVET